MADFELVSDFQAAGDQPKAIAELAAGVEAGDQYQTLLGITGSGKSFTIAGLIAEVQRPTLILAPEQEPRRAARRGVPGVLPQEPGRVLRQLLRLLPARGVHAVERHVHREGQLDQRRDRPAAPQRHQRAPQPARRRHHRQRQRDLRPRLARDLRHPAPDPQRRRGARPAGDPQAPRRAPVRAQRHGVRPQQVPRPRRHDRDLPGVRGARHPRAALRRRDRAHLVGRPGHRRARRGQRHARALPGVALRDPGGVAPAGGRGHRGRADRPAQVARGPRQAARGAAPPHAHHVRPRDDARGRVVRRDRELLAPPRRARRGRGAVHAARLLPEGLPRRPRREPRHRPAAPRAVRGRPLPQGHARRARLPSPERDGQPAAAVRGVRRADQPGRVHVGHARARTSSRCRRARSSSRWCARRA